MPDFIRLTTVEGRRVVVVAAAIGAVRQNTSNLHTDAGKVNMTDNKVRTDVLVQGVWVHVRESQEHVLGLMGVPTNRTVFDERDRPYHELSDDELALAWRQYRDARSVHNLGSAAMLEAELRRRVLVVGEPRS